MMHFKQEYTIFYLCFHPKTMLFAFAYEAYKGQQFPLKIGNLYQSFD
jgi:hypothetical protein